MYNLDQKDRKILAILTVNARATYAQIGKKTRLHKDTVAYRIKQLEKEGIISGYSTFFDLSRLNRRVCKLYVKFRGLSEDEHKNLLSKLKADKAVGWIVEGNGSWDMIIGIQTQKIEEFYKFKLSFEHEFNEKIASLSVTTQMQTYFYPRNYLEHSSEEVILYSGKPSLPIDEKDKKIIETLAENARATALELAKKTNLSARTVSYRIKQLEKEKIILQYRTSINLEKIGYIFVKAFIKLTYITQETRSKMLEFFKHNNVVHNVESLGEWELEPEFEVQNIEHFYNIINKFRTEFSKNILKIDSMLISREYKYGYII
jgi:DNA-binding Lrp family transcriptional regulator